MTERNNTIDFTRGIAMILVVWGHACQLVGGGYRYLTSCNSNCTNASLYVFEWVLCIL